MGQCFSEGGFKTLFWQATRRKSSADRRGWSSEEQEAAYRKGQRLVVILKEMPGRIRAATCA
jgi:hypothetical protein